MTLSYFPFMVNISGKLLVFIGGGKVAERKIESLMRANPQIKVIAEHVTDKIKNSGCTVVIKAADEKDIIGADFLFVCTDDKELNSRLSDAAKSAKIPVNIADNPDMCDFHMPAVFTGADGVTVSVSTHGKNPSLAKTIRDKIADFIERGFI